MAAKGRSTLLRAAGWTLAVFIIWRVGLGMADDLAELQARPLPGSPRWGLIALSGACFLAAHAVLVQTWRAVLASWDERLSFWTAARIWSTSNLGRYVPGKIWQVGAMGALAKQANVSPVAAAGSALLGTLVNVLAGFAVALAAGKALVESRYAGAGDVAIVALVIAVGGLLSVPWIIPQLAPLAARVLGRSVNPTLPRSAVLAALVGNLMAWLVYGAAFQLFVAGVLDRPVGSYTAYLATYTVSYLAGYLAFFAPAGVGVREGSVISLLVLAGLATSPEATLVALTSRVWLTVLEVAPALLFWALAARRPPTLARTDVTT